METCHYERFRVRIEGLELGKDTELGEREKAKIFLVSGLENWEERLPGMEAGN